MTTVKLTAAELSQLWAAYMNNSMAGCVLKHLSLTAEDPEIKQVVQLAVELSEKMLQQISRIYQSEGLPAPLAFSGEDVNMNAPKLFADPFILEYIKQVAGLGISVYGISMSVCPREDVRRLFKENMESVANLLERTVAILLNKGMYVRPPYIPYPEQVEYVHKEGFMNAFLGDRRPLSAIEITNLFINILTNSVGKALITGFMQVAESEEIKELFKRGKGISSKHIEVFGSVLREDDLPAISTRESDVTDSTIAPFSDKLMLYHVLYMNGAGIASYGNAISTSVRRDLTAIYTRLAAEIGTYLDDGAELMIRLGWTEKPPGAVDRSALAGV